MASTIIVYSNFRDFTTFNATYVNSPDSNAYPPAVSDGYTYIALGKVGSKAQITTSTYVGTGTYGESNPNTLTIPGNTIIVILYAITQMDRNQLPAVILVRGMKETVYG